MNLDHFLQFALTVLPGVAYALLGYVGIDYALDFGIYAKANGLKPLLGPNGVNVAVGIVVADLGANAALSAGGIAFVGSLAATGSLKQAAFYALAGAAATSLPAVRSDVISKALDLVKRPAKPAPVVVPPPAAA